MNISENGKLRKIQDTWLTTGNCASSSNEIASIQLSLGSFWGLFLVTGTASALSLVIYLIRLLLQFIRQRREVHESTRPSARCKGFMRSFASYVNKSAIAKDKKREFSGSGKQKKKVVYRPSQVSPPDQTHRSYQSSPLSRSSSLSQGCPFCQSSPSYLSRSPADEIPHLVDNTELEQGSA